MKKMKAAELVIDYTIYPRSDVDAHNVTMLCEALTAGAELPPVIIDKASKRVIDGVHRVKAHLRVLGEDAEIAVIERTYKSEAAMFEDAVRYNAAHGARLDSHDRTHCIIVAQRLHIPLEAMAGALHVPVETLQRLVDTRMGRGAGVSLIPLKRTVGHFAGRKLNARQQEANQKLSGMNQSFYANQLIELIESGMLDKEDERLVERLRKLHELLSELLVA
jgi:hypothetical protein